MKTSKSKVGEKVKFRINRSGDVDTHLWDKNWTASLWLKFLGFYIIKYVKHFQ